jgi:hypothetical protein
MANYLDNGLLAMEKSLRDVVFPALDPADPLAREQLNLAIDYLGFLRSRIDHTAHKLRFELDLYCDMAGQVIVAADGALDTAAMVRAQEAVAPLRTDLTAQNDDLQAAVTRLSETIDDAVKDASASGNDGLRSRVDRAVHSISQHWIDFELAWYAPIAVDPDAPGLKPLTSFFPYRSPSTEPTA